MTLPASRAASSAVARCATSGWRPVTIGERSSLARSLVPITSTATRGCAAIERTLNMAVGVSIIGQIIVSTDAPAASSCADTASTCSTVSTFGITTAEGEAAPAAAMSSAPHSVSRPLHRMVSSRLPYSPDCTAATALARASGFASGATASSRSKIIASAEIVLAFSSARSFAAGM